MMSDKRLVMVCAGCLRALCWHGEFPCDNAQSEDTTYKTVAELKSLGLEHPDNWSRAKMTDIYGDSNPHGDRA